MSWMVEEIRDRGGAVTFDSFMDLALYHPDHGYYSAASPRYGRAGDFLTAPTASEWYPRVVERLLRGIAEPSRPVRIIDLAAGDGAFLACLSGFVGAGPLTVTADVVAVERSTTMRRRLADRFAGCGVACVGSLAEIQPATGPTVLHASELYDAQPVARVVGREGFLRELWVAVEDGDLVWSERGPRDEVVAYFAGHGIALDDGQIAEANLNAERYHGTVLDAAGDHGLVLVLDYGYEAHRLYDPRGRRGGSLATFRRHRVARDPLDSPGDIDLTAHVNWDDLRTAARAAGWVEIGLWPLAEFLVRAGLAEELDERGLGVEAEIDAATFSARQEIKRLLDPDGMGSDLKVLVQAHGEMIDVARRLLAPPQR